MVGRGAFEGFSSDNAVAEAKSTAALHIFVNSTELNLSPLFDALHQPLSQYDTQ